MKIETLPEAIACLEGLEEFLKRFQSLLAPSTDQGRIYVGVGSVTGQQLEDRIRKKSARVGTLALQFGVRDEDILALIADPASKVYRAYRGWVKLKEPMPQLPAERSCTPEGEAPTS